MCIRPLRDGVICDFDVCEAMLRHFLVEALAEEGRAGRFELPRALPGRDDIDFSFSGVKTAVRLHLESLGPEPTRQDHADLARALQDAVVDVLVSKTERALARTATPVEGLALAGGVAANGPLREGFAALAARHGLEFRPTPLAYCTDNAAMVAWAGRLRLIERGPDPLSLSAFARGELTSWDAARSA